MSGASVLGYFIDTPGQSSLLGEAQAGRPVRASVAGFFSLSCHRPPCVWQTACCWRGPCTTDLVVPGVSRRSRVYEVLCIRCYSFHEPEESRRLLPAHPEGVQALSWQVVNPVEGLSLHGEAGSQGPISRPCLPASRPCCAVPPPSVSRLPEEMSKRGERAERAGGLMNFFRLGGGLGLESLRQLLGWSDSWRRCDGGHALHQKRTLFPRGLGAEAATMPSSSRMRCTPS